MICNLCGAPLMVIRVEEYPEGTKDKINYNRLCDVKCLNEDCRKIYYSQSYDFGRKINQVKNLNDEKE